MKVNSIVRFKPKVKDKDGPFLFINDFTRDLFVYLGDIAQMPGHCIIVRETDSKVLWGYHIDDLEEITEEECKQFKPHKL